MQNNKNVQCISHINIRLVKTASSSKKACKADYSFDEGRSRVQKLSTFDNHSLTGVTANKDRLPTINISSHDVVW